MTWGDHPGKLAWVTGASSGIGLAISERLLADGWRVRGFSRTPPNLASAHFQHQPIDLSQPFSLTLSETPTALVHAAGLMHTAALGALDHEAGEKMWRVHVDAAARFANQVLPAMQARPSGQSGRVVLISSRVAAGKAGRSHYAASKAALIALARSWAAEVVASGITVNVVSPAATNTPMLHSGERATSAPVLPPMGRLIEPAEVAALVAFLLSDAACAITGQDIAVCGGSSLPK
ncbi:MAG: hypothetical protein RLZZ502_1066 [Pseudomonadota bacterium]|jgi:NAD(P)-dependent dehydrogenase (short-subunit alcohol dehydrogenase family)